jgi:hypothetical protein
MTSNTNFRSFQHPRASPLSPAASSHLFHLFSIHSLQKQAISIHTQKTNLHSYKNNQSNPVAVLPSNKKQGAPEATVARSPHPNAKLKTPPRLTLSNQNAPTAYTVQSERTHGLHCPIRTHPRLTLSIQNAPTALSLARMFTAEPNHAVV